MNEKLLSTISDPKYRLTDLTHEPLVVLWLGRRTCDQQVTSMTPSPALLG